MHLRRTRLLAAAALLLAAPTLASCGFDYATNRVNTIGEGVTDRSASVDVLGAAIVASTDGSGTFITTFSNNDEEADSFVSLTGGGDVELTAGAFEPVEIPGGGAVNLVDTPGVRLTGDFGIGDFVSIVVGFEGGEQVTMEIPVVAPCYEYEGLDTAPASEASGSTVEEPYACEPAEGPEE